MSKWVIQITEVRNEPDSAPAYFFRVHTRTKRGVLIPTTSSDEPLVLNEENFHELTSLLNADVYNGELQVLRDGDVNGPSEEVMNWVRGIRGKQAGDFLMFLSAAALQADPVNIVMMLPLLRQLMHKYPEYSERRHGHG